MDIKVSEARMHLPVAIYILVMTIVPFLLQNMTFLILIPLVLGLFENIIHVAGIFIHKLKKPHSPGMITGLVLFGYSLFVIAKINQQGGLHVYQ